MANKEALTMLTTMRKEVLSTLEWQKAVLEKMKTLSPETFQADATTSDFTPDTVTAVNVSIMGHSWKLLLTVFL